MSEYTAKALAFLRRHGMTFKVSPTAKNECPRWDDEKHIHGNEHIATFRRDKAEQESRQFSIHFWNSYNDAMTSKLPTAYDVLACLEKYEPEDFENWCGEFGYSTDSRKAEATYKACVEQWEKVRKFFTDEELKELQEVN